MKFSGENVVEYFLSFKGGDLPSARLISAHAHRDDGFHDHAITILLVFIILTFASFYRSILQNRTTFSVWHVNLPPSWKESLQEAQSHFRSKHSVSNLLTSRATKVAVLPSSLSCHHLVYPLPHMCLLCKHKDGRGSSDGKL